MQKLSGSDASFLYNETDAAPHHIGVQQRLALAPGQTPDAFYSQFRQVMAERVHLVHFLTQRLQAMPFGVDHPAWVRASDFDIDNHLLRLTLPAPGGQAELDQACAEIYEARLDRRRPLWEFWVIDGLAEADQVALVTKVHHACVDGVSGNLIYHLIGDPTAEIRTLEPEPKGFWDAEPVNYADLMRESWFNLARYSVDGWTSLPRVMRGALRGVTQQLSNNRYPTSAPKVGWNAPIDGKRAMAGAEISLAEVKAIAKASGVKLNDVVLALTAGALNRYLDRRGELPHRPLIAGCPVSLRDPSDTTLNNQVGMMMVSLENHIGDAMARMQAVREASLSAKALLAAQRDAISSDFGAAFLPALFAGSAQANRGGEYMHLTPEVPCNLVLSNVPGLQAPLYYAGARALTQRPLSIVVHGGGLNVTVVSFGDQLQIGLTAAARVMPDVDVLAADFVAAFAEMKLTLLPIEIEAAPQSTKPAAPAELEPLTNQRAAA
ncbi:MAG: wax ester/triacylglycerol synthase family O-acyltransferase [Pseudomonadota bacterium]